MSLTKPLPTDIEPAILLIRWRIMKTGSGTRHFVGVRPEDLSGRVSSAILHLDLQDKYGVTASGRTYQLDGDPGWSDNADFVWAAWRQVNGIASYVDVTRTMIENAKRHLQLNRRSVRRSRRTK